MQTNFIDYVKTYFRSGKGGAGSVHLYRSRSIPKGGPDGGDGGRGGHIILRGNSQLWTLLHLKYRKHIFAKNGQDGSSNNKTGSNAKDIIVNVPLGTVVKDFDTGKVLFEITEDKEEKYLLKGGRGGLGNTNFKSSTNQTPRYAQPGEPTKELTCILELKLLADVGLVGFPNAGKSTLLSTLTAAKPKIADYPFTTLTPNLGIVNYFDEKSFVMADIPGIIEGASDGKGLGLRFLKHIERNSILLFLVPADSKEVTEEFNILLSELEKFNPELMHKNKLLAISKSDMLDQELIDEITQTLPKNIEHVFISSFTSLGLNKLKNAIWEEINEYKKG